jgi:hypothetical protein
MLQGKASNMGIIMAGTKESVEDDHKGVFSYDALRSRLVDGRFASANVKDMLAPIIRLAPLSHEEMCVLMERLSNIHAVLFDYEAQISPEKILVFLNAEYNRAGAETLITPREMIRDFIELLNILNQNPDMTVENVLGSSEFEFADGSNPEEDIDEEFASFEI